MRHSARTSAFTIAELLIGVLVLSGILTASYLCLDAGLKTQSVLEERSDLVQRARVVLDLIARDLRSACPLSADREFIGMDRDIDGMEADNVDFATHRWDSQTQGEGDFCEISYYVDRNRETGLFGLYRRRDPTPDVEILDGGMKEEILPGIESFKLEYSDGFFWFDKWGKQREREQEETERTLLLTNVSGLPDAVRITISLSTDPNRERERRPRTLRIVEARDPLDSDPLADPGDEREVRDTSDDSGGDPSVITLQTVVFLNLAELARSLQFTPTGS
ncbi:MAG: hypothetical protein AAF517_27145, partial [Planctomycetota bacterium]